METTPNQRTSFPFAILFLAAATTIATVWISLDANIPLGKPGEWVWNRAEPPPISKFVVPAICLAGYLVIVFLGRAMAGFREWMCILALPLLIAGGAVVQFATLESANHGIDRWPFAVLGKETSGYFAIARANSNMQKFLREYGDWIKTQDSFHVGTHPPGLFLLNRWVIQYFEKHPDHAEQVLLRMPNSFASGLAEADTKEKLSQPAQAAVAGIAVFTWLAALLTVIPVYLLARLGTSPSSAFLAAAIWPLIPAAPMFLPLSDCLFPLIAATTILLVLWSAETELSFFTVLAGLLCSIGVFCSLAFLVVAALAVVVMVLTKVTAKKVSVVRLIFHLVVFCAGFALPGIYCYHNYQKMNLPTIYLTNAEKHAAFYSHMPRTYLAWIWINLAEFALVLGPAVVALLTWIIPSRRTWNGKTGVSIVFLGALMTILALDLSGKNMSEVGRLWIFLTPFACVSTALAAERAPSRTIVWLLLLTLQFVGLACLCTFVEPLLPIPIPK